MALPDFIREKTTIWDFLKNDATPLVLYGMGNGADIVISQLEKIGRKPSEIIASDDFVRGQLFHDYKVKKLSQVEEELGDFIVLICFGTQIDSVIENIKSIARKHKTYVAYVPVFGENIMTENFLLENIDDIIKARNLFKDELSLKAFDCCLNFYIFGKLFYLFDCESEKDEVFENILKLKNNESYLDLGAYRGDTIEEFLKYSNGNYSHITALEPDKKTFTKLLDYGENLENACLLNKGIWNREEVLYFENRCARGSSLSGEIKGKKALPVEVTTVDALDREFDFTYIKADVEGAEKEMLMGSLETLKKGKAKWNIAVYHRTEDFFRLPLLIHSINPNYSFYMRHHKYVPFWDTNIYCVLEEL